MTMIELMCKIKNLLDSGTPEDTLVMAEDCVAYRDVSGYLRYVTQEDADNHGDCSGIVGEQIFAL